MRLPHLILAAIAITAAAAIATTHTAHNTTIEINLTKTILHGLNTSITAYYTIYVNNTPIAHGIDPVNINFLKSIISTLIPRIEYGLPGGIVKTIEQPTALNYVATDGTTLAGYDFEYPNTFIPSILVCYSTTQQQITSTIYTISNPICNNIEQYSLTVNTTTAVVTFSAAWYIQSQTTVYAIATMITTRTAGRNILVAAEATNTTIPANTTLRIEYTFVIKKQLPLTVNGWNIILGYFFAARKYGYTTSVPLTTTAGTSGAFDTGIDYGTYDMVKDYAILLPMPSCSVSTTAAGPTLSGAMVLDVWNITTVDVGNTTCLNITLVGHRQFSSVLNISGVAIVRHVDINADGTYAEGWYVVACVPIPSVSTDFLSASLRVDLCGS